MNKQILYITAIVLLSVPAALYFHKYSQEDYASLINKEFQQQPTAAGMPEKKWKSGQILVKPKAGLSDAEFEVILSKSRGKALEKIGGLPVHVVSVPENAEEAVARALARNPHIDFAELDMYVDLSETTVDDQYYSIAWHLPKIQAPTAWDYIKGEGVIIAILDTGVDGTHPDLVNQLLPGYNSADGSSTTSDVMGHGTATAGTAAAATNNTIGVSSIAWGAKILPIRVTNDPTGAAYFSSIARGVTWAADNNATVANISFDGISNSSTVTTAAQYMRNKGGIVVAAAGNSGIDPGYTDNPYIISVSATDSADAKASWSNYGNFIDVAAPGVSIVTTKMGNSYSKWSGTSFSSPAAAGVVALIMAANPSLTPTDVEQILEQSADKVAGSDFHPYFGYGRVNAAAAVQLALDSAVSDTTAPIVNIFSPTDSVTVAGLVQVDVSASDNEAVSQVALYANGQLVGEDSVAPYQFSWDTSAVADGSVILTATATDAVGNEGASEKVTITVANQVDNSPVDNTPPNVSISNPKDGSTVNGLVKINVDASDDVEVARIELYVDGRLVSSTSTSPLAFNWNTRKVSRGYHMVEAVAIDTANNSADMTIQVKR